MYKARAEQIYGNKVFAGGKWLTCIGNKNVHVGDYVWTDGRCAYGNVMESGTPFIPSIIEEEETIPLYFRFIKDKKTLDNFAYYDGRKYKNVPNGEQTPQSLLIQTGVYWIEDSTDYTKDYLVNNKNGAMIIREKDYNNGDQNFPGFLDAEYDSGDIFVLSNYLEIDTATPRYSEGRHGGKIFKNSEEIKNFHDELCDDFYLEDQSPEEGFSYSTRKTKVTVFDGTIDNEGNYNLLFNRSHKIDLEANTTASLMLPSEEELLDDTKTRLQSYIMGTQFSRENQAVISIKNKKYIIIKADISYSGKYYEEQSEPYEIRIGLSSETKTVYDLIMYVLFTINTPIYECIDDYSVKVPLADGFYFTFALPNLIRNPNIIIESIDNYFEDKHRDNLAAYELCEDVDEIKYFPLYFPNYPSGSDVKEDAKFSDPYKVNIYDKNNNLVLKNIEYYSLPLNIRICKIKGSKYLLFPFHQRIENSNDFKEILALVSYSSISQKTKLIKEIKREDFESPYSCKNFRLRKMKNIKKWKSIVSKEKQNQPQ